MSRQAIFGAVCVAACLAFGGCFKEKRDVTLNPDGSGKLTYEYRGPIEMIQVGEKKSDPQEQARKEVARILSESEGVSAWKDVSYEVDNATTLTFKGTAYFKALNKLNIQAGGGGGLDLKPVWDTKSPEPRLEIARKDKTKEGTTAPPAKLTDAEIAQKAAEAKAKFKQSLPMLAAMLTDLRIEWSFSLPGAPDQTVNFQKAADRPNTVRVVYDGAKILEVLNGLANDDAFWKAEAAAGRSADDGPPLETLNEKLFGARGPVATSVKPPLIAQFDYVAEVAAAQAGFQTMMTQLKIAAAAPSVPAAGGPFKALHVGFVQAGYCVKTPKGQFGDEDRYTLQLIGELPGSVLRVTEGAVESATADNGDSLLPGSALARKIQLPSLDNDVVVFDVPLRVPGPNAKGIKEVSGTLKYIVAGGAKKVDLGMVALKAGTQAQELGAKIVSVGKSNWNAGVSEVRLSLKADAQNVKDVKFLDADGQPITVQENACMGGGEEEVTFTYTKDGEFPAEARIVVTLYDNLKDFTVGFKLENVDLLGRPVK